MTKEKWLEVEMPDGSSWRVPLKLVEADHYAYYGDDADHSEPDDDTLIDWAENNMNWDEVQPHAVMVGAGIGVDYDDGWANGDKEIVEVEAAEAVTP